MSFVGRRNVFVATFNICTSGFEVFFFCVFSLYAGLVGPLVLLSLSLSRFIILYVRLNI